MLIRGSIARIIVGDDCGPIKSKYIQLTAKATKTFSDSLYPAYTGSSLMSLFLAQEIESGVWPASH